MYYLAILLPLVAFMILIMTKGMSGTDFLLFLIAYFHYRIFIDYSRLVSKKIIDKQDFWKLFIPGARFKYFRQLYLP